jgi:hypothetical protein
VRIRIALTTAVAVIIALPAVPVALFTTASAASAKPSRHEAVSLSRSNSAPHAVRLKDKLMSYSQAHKVAQIVASAEAVQAAQAATFYKDLAFFTAAAAASSENSIPAAWMPTAICEEGGRDDPYAGYFGILAWDGFDGYPTAGGAPLSVQLAWESAHGQGPPDAPGQCHSY